MDENRLIGTGHGLPWRLPLEIAHFREYTKGKWLLVGRKTFDEMGGWFDEGRVPLVLTARRDWKPEVGRAVATVPEALALTESAGQDELVCLGGGHTFAAAMPYVDRLVLTIVHHRYPAGEGAAYFPEFDKSAWRDVKTKEFPRDDKHESAFTIHWMEKR
jgi:dihydrofolate reductase